MYELDQQSSLLLAQAEALLLAQQEMVLENRLCDASLREVGAKTNKNNKNNGGTLVHVAPPCKRGQHADASVCFYCVLWFLYVR